MQSIIVACYLYEAKKRTCREKKTKGNNSKEFCK